MLKLVLKKLKYFDLVIYLRNNYAPFAKYYSYLSFYRKSKKHIALVYTMGKVGSTTLEHWINNQLEDYSVYHVHWLTKQNLDTDTKFNDIFFQRNKKAGIEIDVFPNYLSRGYYVRNKIALNRKEREHYKIFSLTRDPIARNISSFFQNLKRWYCYDVLLKRQEMSEVLIADELTTLFNEKYIGKNRIDYIDCNPLTWFDQELKTIFDIDVYQYEFPKEKGYNIYEKENVSALILRMEDLNDCFEEASKEFLGKDLEIKRIVNKGEQKEYSGIYKKFKQIVEIPDWYLDEIYESRYARHFYTSSEIEAFRSRWSR